MDFTLLYLTQGWNFEMKTMMSLFVSLYESLYLDNIAEVDLWMNSI